MDRHKRSDEFWGKSTENDDRVDEKEEKKIIKEYPCFIPSGNLLKDYDKNFNNLKKAELK